MRHHPHTKIFLVLAGAVILAACGGESHTGAQAVEKGEACRETPAAELTPSGHGCALAAEMQAIADTLATVTDQASADRAVPLLRKSGERLKAIKIERLKLNDDPQAGAKGAMVGMHVPGMSAASRKIVDESMRIAQSFPQAFLTINSAMEEIEF
jgi:hypothetical protein